MRAATQVKRGRFWTRIDPFLFGGDKIRQMSTTQCATCQQAIIVSIETVITVEDGSQLIRCGHCGAFTTVSPESAQSVEYASE